jgi:ubiquinone/menaquinone biosynthesis C-methylase UbiE
MSQPAWFYDEMRHSGVDYSDSAQVAVYDQRHRKFRDYRRGAEAVVQLLGLRPEHTVVDMGSGTGAFALHAAPFCKTIYAVDVSRAMLDYCRQKAAGQNLRNIIFCHGGFLTYDHAADPVDAVVSTAVLHHLPDFWKFVGLLRVNRLLKSGGKFYLFDVVFPGAEKDIRKPVEEWKNSMKEKVGPEFAAEVETHIRDEFSTYDWIMEGLLTRAGFRIDRTDYSDGFGAGYLCVKTG